MALKGNQPQLHKAVAETFTVEQAKAFEGYEYDFHKTVYKGYGHGQWAGLA